MLCLKYYNYNLMRTSMSEGSRTLAHHCVFIITIYKNVGYPSFYIKV